MFSLKRSATKTGAIREFGLDAPLSKKVRVGVSTDFDDIHKMNVWYKRSKLAKSTWRVEFDNLKVPRPNRLVMYRKF